MQDKDSNPRTRTFSSWRKMVETGPIRYARDWREQSALENRWHSKLMARFCKTRGERAFDRLQEEERAEFAQAADDLLAIAGIEEVSIDTFDVHIRRKPDAAWSDIGDKIVDVLKRHKITEQ